MLRNIKKLDDNRISRLVDSQMVTSVSDSLRLLGTFTRGKALVSCNTAMLNKAKGKLFPMSACGVIFNVGFVKG